MFREIRRTEKITETDEQKRLMELRYELFNTRVETERHVQLLAEIEKLENANARPAFNPDARIF